jgi:cobalt-zinc-cadmium efflux system outer membrane protein
LLAGAASAHARDVAPEPIKLPEFLSLEDALRIFRQRGLDLLIADAAVYNAEGDVKVAGVIPNPNWSVGGYHSFFAPDLFESNNGWFVGLGDSNALEDSLSGKRYLRLKAARAALEAARQTRADAQRTLEFQLKQAYIQAVLARDALDFALEVQKGWTQTYDLQHLRYQKGAINEADEARVETAKLEADQAVDQATLALRAAKVAIAFLLGVRGSVPDFKVEQDLPKFAISGTLAAASRDSLLREAYDHRPDLKSIRKNKERAEAAWALARRLRFPDIALNFQYSAQGSGNGATSGPATTVTTSRGDTVTIPGAPLTPIAPPTIQFGLSGTLPVFYFQQGEIRKAEADFRTQDYTRAKIEAQVASDVEGAYAGFDTNRKLVQRMEARLLDRARRARDLVLLQYQKGAASLLEYLDAQRTYISTNVEYLQDLANYWTAVFQLEQAVGMDLR